MAGRRRTAEGQARCDAVLDELRSGAIWRCHPLAQAAGMSYSQAMAACGQLLEDGLIERITGEELGPWVPCGAVGWRIRLTADLLPELEEMWAMS